MFVAISTNDYGYLMAGRFDLTEVDGYGLTGNSASAASGRVAHALGLDGPAMSVDTACSSSLVALHLACQSLRRRECGAALVGGASVMLSPFSYVAFCRMGALSRSGACRAFDANADGFVRGEGCGVVVLKRLADAVAAGDRILAVVRGSAVNHDGRSSGLTVPHGPSQQEVMRRALREANVAAADVSYVEAHGTGTSLGDPVELLSLGAVYGEGRVKEQPLLIGSVKTNVGHLESAAGMAGMMKVILALQHGVVPPQLHFQEPNPRVDWSRLPLRVVTEACEWPSRDGIRAAGVSAFGISGTNAHVVIEAADAYRVADPVSQESNHQLFTLSAKSESRLRQAADRFGSYVADPDASSLESICQTAHLRRAHLDWRLTAVVRTRDELRPLLTAVAGGGTPAGVRLARRLSASPAVTFLFAGQGGQVIGVGERLYRAHAAFRHAVDACGDLARGYLDRPLADVMFDAQRRGQPFPDLVSSHLAQFALQYGLSRLWRSWGIEPATIVSQSLGEFAAAVAASVFDLDVGLTLVAERARLIVALTPPSSMAVVLADAARVRALSPSADVWVAGRNTPHETLVGGKEDGLERLLAACEAAGVQVRRFRALASYAPHTPLMEPVMSALHSRFRVLSLQRPTVEMFSALTGGVIDDDIRSPEYWVMQSSQPFDMPAVVAAWLDTRPAAALEIGPGTTMLGIARRCAPSASLEWLPSLRRDTDEVQMLDSLAALHVLGAAVDWNQFEATRWPVATLPFTPFQLQDFWLPDPQRASRIPSGGDAGAVWLGERLPSPVRVAQFLAEVDSRTVPFLRDHRVHDRIVVAASAHVSRCLAAVRAIHGWREWAIEQMLFSSPLVLPDDERRLVTLTIDPDAGSPAKLTIASRDITGSGRWVVHVTATLRKDAGAPEQPKVGLRDARAQCAESMPVDAFYDDLRARGYRMGGAFRWLDQIWRRDGMAVARLRAMSAVENLVPPGVVDACLQLLSATAPRESSADLPTYVPYEIDSLTVHAEPRGSLWAIACLRETAADGKTVTGDVWLADDEGTPFITISGLRARALTPEVLSRSIAPPLIASTPAVYTLQWRSSVIDGGSPSARDWIVFADSTGVADRLVPLLEARGGAALVIEPGDSCVQIGAWRWRIRTDNPADYRAALAQAAAGRRRPVEVLHLWALEPDRDEDVAELQRWGSESVLLTAQALASAQNAHLSLRCVTRCAAGPFAAGPNPPSHAAVWGLGQAIGREYPGLWRGLIDLGFFADPSHAAAALARELEVGDREEHVALDPDGRHVLRLAGADPLWTPLSLAFPENAAWLLTGGLGVLGLTLAEWLVSRGVRHIALVGRSAGRGDAAARVAAMEEGGAHIITRMCDVADRPSLQRALDEIRSSLPPLDGVAHLAGILDDRMIAEETVDHWRRVFAPKALGAWHLHRLLEDASLRHFVLFSSAAAVAGAPGQAAYAAANAMLDALARFRKSRGLPATSIAWGPWQSGMASRDRTAVARWRRFGIEPLAIVEAAEHFETAFADPREHIVVIKRCEPTDAASWQAEPPLFDAINKGVRPSAAPLASDLAIMAPAQRRAALIERLQATSAVVLGVSRAAAIDIEQPLQELGMDSMMAVELRNALTSVAGQELPVTLVFDYPSIARIADFVLESVLHLEAGEPPPPAEPRPADATTERISAMSDEEAAERLTRTLAELGS